MLAWTAGPRSQYENANAATSVSASQVATAWRRNVRRATNIGYYPRGEGRRAIVRRGPTEERGYGMKRPDERSMEMVRWLRRLFRRAAPLLRSSDRCARGPPRG